MGVAAWLTLTLGALMFMVVGAVGLFLILRIEPSPHAQREISSDQGEEEGGGADLRANCGETAKRRSGHHTGHTDPTRPHKALQPPRRR